MKFLPYKAYNRKGRKRRKNSRYLGVYATRRKEFAKYEMGRPKVAKILERLSKDNIKIFWY